MILHKQSMVNMSNNLANCVELSGMTNNEVAAAKGVTPETLRRHKNGKIQMTIRDAEHYARILNVSIAEILFKEAPIPVIGSNIIQKESIERTLHTPQKYEVYGLTNHEVDRAAILWEIAKPYTGQFYDWDGAVQTCKLKPIVDKYVDQDCFQHISVVKSKTPFPSQEIDQKGKPTQLTAGVVYPQPHGLFTVHNGKFGHTYTDLDLEWAAPTLSVVFRPDLVGIIIKKVGE